MRRRSIAVALCFSLFSSVSAWGIWVAPPPPANDNFANATTISIPFDQTAYNYGATSEAGEPTDCIGSRTKVRTTWYKFSTIRNLEAALTIHTGSASTVAIYKGGPTLSNLTLVECRGREYYSQRFGLSTAPNETYYLQLNVDYYESGPVYQAEQKVRVTAEEGGSIAGLVTDDAGAGLPGICVTAIQGGYTRRTTSVGSDGRYRVIGLPAASYTILFTDCVDWIYFYEYFGDTRDSSLSPLVDVAAGTNIENINVTLTRGAHLTGILTGSDGPASNECVRVVKADGSYVAEERADSEGRYSIGALHTGTYKVRLGCGRSDRYQSIWFDGKDDLASADDVNLTLGQDFNLSYQLPDLVPAANDNLVDALDGSALPYVHDTLTRGTSVEAGEQTCGYGTHSTLWYRYTPSRKTRITAKAVASAFVPALAVYAAVADTSSQAGLMQVKCAFRPFPFYNDWDPRLDFTAEPGLTYFIQVGAMGVYAGTEGGRMLFSLSEEDALSNDQRSEATVIPALPYSSGSVQMHKTSAGPDDPIHDCGAATHTAWYKYSPPEDERVRVYGGGNWTLGGLAVFESTDIGSGIGAADLLQIGCINQYPGPVFDMKAGKTYYFQLFQPWSELNYWPELGLGLARA